MDTVDGRLRWRCRRGTQELDRLLTGFLDEHGSELSTADLDAFTELLGNEDDQLADWLINARTEPTDEALQGIVRRIRAYAGL